MDQSLLLPLLPAAVAFAALLLAGDAWVRSEDSLLHRAWAAYTAWYKERAEYLLDRTPVKKQALRQAGYMLAALFAGALFVGDPLAVAVIVTAAGEAPFLLYQQRVQARREALQQQIDSALQFLANALQVTPNLDDALGLVADHFKPPMAEEVARVVASYRLGRSLDDALQGMAERCNDPFITSMVIALVIGRRTGGNISATLRRIAHATREAVRVELELSSKTRGQRNQFYVVVLLYPIGLIALRSVLPDAWHVLTTTFVGKAALGTSLAVVAVAIFWAQKILSPDNL